MTCTIPAAGWHCTRPASHDGPCAAKPTPSIPPALVEELRGRIAELEAALEKISAIRDSIVGMQGFNFSEHAYPLVAVLGSVGYEGAGYEISRKNLGTLIDQAKAADALAERYREALAAEDAYWAASRSHAAALPRLRAETQAVFDAAALRRDRARLALTSAGKPEIGGES